MLMRGKNFYKELNIDLLSGVKVKKISSKKNMVEISSGIKIPYDKLLIASGSRPNFPDIPGLKLNGVFGLRTIDDAKNIAKQLVKTKNAVIIGGGLVSCKAAYSLVKRGVKVTIIVASNRLLSRMLDSDASLIIQKKAKALGIEIKFGTDVKEILGDQRKFCRGKNEVTGVVLTDSTKINCEIVLICKGVKPNMDFLKGSGVRVDRGVIVDRYLNTNILNIYAAGDVAQAYDMLYKDNRINAMWPPAIIQGRIAGLNMSGEIILYDGLYPVNIGEFFGVPAVSLGISCPPQDDFEEIVINNSEGGKYKKFVLIDKKLVGYINIGDVFSCGFINNLIHSQIDITNLIDDLKIRKSSMFLILKNQYLK
jgi:NAD(P)H-nitrite reductase large subunit